MSRKMKSLSRSGSETQEETVNGFDDKVQVGRKLGAHFFINGIERNTPSDSLKSPALQCSSSPGLGVKSWTRSRSRAALWPTDSDPDEGDKNNNSIRAMEYSSRHELSGTSEGNVTTSSRADELTIVAEQLQTIQETQDLILSQLRSDIESLQTENLCLQHNNTTLRIQVDHLNQLVYELSKELNLMREFVNARKEHSQNNKSAVEIPDNSSENSVGKSDDVQVNLQNFENTVEILSSDIDSTKPGPKTLKSKKSVHSPKEQKQKKQVEKPVKKTRPFRFIASIFRPRTPDDRNNQST